VEYDEDHSITDEELDEILKSLEEESADPSQEHPAPQPAPQVDPAAQQQMQDPNQPAPAPQAPPVDPAAQVQDPNQPAPQAPVAEDAEEEDEGMEEIDLESLLREIDSKEEEDEEEEEEEESVHESAKEEDDDEEEEDDEGKKFDFKKLKKENKNLRIQLKESIKTIQFQREKLSDVNLLNNKLLFTNKLFKEYALSDEQKMKIVENFDDAKTVHEVKLAYKILAESFNSGASTVKRKAKANNTVAKSITEGLASSKVVGSTKPTSIVENVNKVVNGLSNDAPTFQSRLQYLANIKKPSNNKK